MTCKHCKEKDIEITKLKEELWEYKSVFEDRLCMVRSCKNKHYAKDLCRKHYDKARRNGGMAWSD